MSGVVAIIGAVAAVVAAVLAGINIWVGGRRDERKWVREALVETFVDYLQSSFRQEARGVLEERQSASPDPQMIEMYRGRCGDAHADQMRVLTRLRLLAPRSAVRAAEGLHAADHEVVRFAFEAPLPCSEAAWLRVRTGQRTRRETVIEEARKALDLRDAAPIDDYDGRSIDDLVSGA